MFDEENTQPFGERGEIGGRKDAVDGGRGVGETPAEPCEHARERGMQGPRIHE